MENECKFCCNNPVKRIGYIISQNQKWAIRLQKVEEIFTLEIGKDGSDKSFIKKINYCPFCGRNLNEKGGKADVQTAKQKKDK